MRKPLNSGWTLMPASGAEVPPEVVAVGPIPATVPGCVHTDLLAAGLIPDPFHDRNETALHWIGETTWHYATTFAWHGPGGHDRVDLVCAGLDTVAEIELNGVPLGSTANMHRSYRFDVRDGLRPGSNELRIVFRPAREYARHWQRELGDRPNAYPEPFNFIRKMACNFGWDWGPTLVTAGIWQPIELDLWHTARLQRVRPLVTVDANSGRVDVHADIERAADGPLTLTATIATHTPSHAAENNTATHTASQTTASHATSDRPGHTASQTTAGHGASHTTSDRASHATSHTASTTVDNSTATATVHVPNPRLWWPRGYGEQPRYDLEVTLTDSAGTKLDTWHRKIGFRDVRLDTAPDEHGTPFTVTVNDQPIFVRGVNWIPDDVFPTRITRDRLEQRFRQAQDANVNLLRVWGGGRYESDDFYDLADEYGLMVTQDFLFACAAYPEEEPFASEVAAEAAEQVVRLASHPSLLWWCGNNENLWGHEDWGWRAELGERTWGAGYYHRVLPEIVERLDPTRPYWPGSPWSGTKDRHPNDPAHGTMHIWDVWNRLDYAHYRDHRPRFVAEFGYQAPPAWATIEASITDDPLTPTSPGMSHHQRAADGDQKLQRGLDAHFKEPRDTADWHYLTQVNQARAITTAVEHFRALRPYCMGTIVWQLNDCWPVTSWSAVDGQGRRKPMWHALRRAYADRLLTLDQTRAVLVNETATPWHTELTVQRSTLDGKSQEERKLKVTVAPYGKEELAHDVSRPDDLRAEVLWAEADGADRAWHFYAEDKDIAYPQAAYDVALKGRNKLTVTARTFLRDLTVYPDRLDPAAEADDALRNLFPGEAVTFTIVTAAALDERKLTSKPVLRCVND
ncbi:beta-mannosidase [Asanoa ishikariensis]|uniref:beta-mannosidase n=1 Tax=Asanoa ishikariensis TaxID=137265 RepID=A0A1H3RGW2_9ACTN|nr:glycoside hydrolase family 2 TIM barrel-domain containing protein [Asanoa ishikariensis]GIF67222.1 beta-mannosidase [Asanoa ishikariensis]SDZ24927.1 beta-mannosidase [Asanoa ishikariensis]